MILSETLGDKYEEKITYRIGWPTGNIWRSLFYSTWFDIGFISRAFDAQLWRA